MVTTKKKFMCYDIPSFHHEHGHDRFDIRLNIRDIVSEKDRQYHILLMILNNFIINYKNDVLYQHFLLIIILYCILIKNIKNNEDKIWKIILNNSMFMLVHMNIRNVFIKKLIFRC
jgi:hypothetical protein